MFQFIHSIFHAKSSDGEDKQPASQLNHIKQTMNTTLQQLLSRQLIEPQQLVAIDNIVHHYLARRPNGDTDLTQIELLVSKFSQRVKTELNRCRNRHQSDWLKRKLRTFWLLLPSQDSGYNHRFYNRQLEGLILALGKTQHSYQQQLQH